MISMTQIESITNYVPLIRVGELIRPTAEPTELDCRLVVIKILSLRRVNGSAKTAFVYLLAAFTSWTVNSNDGGQFATTQLYELTRLRVAKVWQTESDGYFIYWPRSSDRRNAQQITVCQLLFLFLFCALLSTTPRYLSKRVTIMDYNQTFNRQF